MTDPADAAHSTLLRCRQARKSMLRHRRLLDSRWTARREAHTILGEQIERPGAMRPGVFYVGGKMSDAPHYRTEQEIEDVVHRFESCAYTPEEFVHARHLTVAAWFFATMEPAAAKDARGPAAIYRAPRQERLPRDDHRVLARNSWQTRG